MFDIQLLENSPGTPSFYKVLITVLFALMLSSLIAITYEMTTRSIYRRAHFLQSMVLISLVAATVMQAIGDSLARGLGMLGALAIIRFRTVLDDPRNITFMFASLASGIACGVFGFNIALTGTIVFCLAAFLLHFTPYSHLNELIGEVRIQLPEKGISKEELLVRLKEYFQQVEEEQIKVNTSDVERRSETGEIIMTQIVVNREYNFLVRLRKGVNIEDAHAGLSSIDGLNGLRLNFKKQPSRL